MTALRCFSSEAQNDWDLFLSPLAFSYRTTVVVGAKDTPFKLVYGRDLRYPIDTMLGRPPSIDDSVDSFVDRLQIAHEFWRERQFELAVKQKEKYDKRQRLVEFQPNEVVFVHTPTLPRIDGTRKLKRKLALAARDPCRILKKMGLVTYLVRNLVTGKEQVVHVQRLIKTPADEWTSKDVSDISSEGLSDEGQNEDRKSVV